MKGENEKYFEVLSKIPIFSSLTAAELDELKAKIKIKTVKKNEVALNQDDSNEFMYIVLDGAVKVIRLTEDGKEVLLAIREAGEYFGEMSLIDGHKACAEVSATKDSVIALINKKSFHSLLDSNPKIQKNLLEEFSRRLRASNCTIHLFNHDKVAQRLKLFFKQYAQEFGQVRESGVTLNLKLTKQEIADRIGFSRQRVSEAMSQMEIEQYLLILPDKHIHLTSKFFDNYDNF
ncbi:MAG: Crp/Fnr family transcriptional regulator [Nitrospirae bacterium]|nr:Crp/Fnr family transcriptional regulator [Nitrospirota bacterium]